MSPSWEKEVKALQKDKAKAQKANNLREEATICNLIGDLLASHGHYKEAIEEHQQELQLSEALNDVIGTAVANRKIGESWAMLENYSRALKHQQKHLELSRSMGNRVEEQRALATIGRTYLFYCDTDPENTEALQKAEEAFLASLKIVDQQLEVELPWKELNEMRARLFLNLGLVYDHRQDAARSQKFFRKSIFLAEKNNLTEDLYRANFILGNLHFRGNELSRALRHLEAARDWAQRARNRSMETEAYAAIGQIMLHLGDFVAAKRSLRKAYKLGPMQSPDYTKLVQNLKTAIKGIHLEEGLSELPESDLLGNMQLCEQLGDLYSKIPNYLKALACYTNQLEYAERLEKPACERAVIHVSLATTYVDLKEFSQAEQHFLQELQLRGGNAQEECETWLNIANVREEMGRSFADVAACYHCALNSAKKDGLRKLQVKVLKLLLAAQEKFGSDESGAAGAAAAAAAELRQLGEGHGDGAASESDADSDSAEEAENSEPIAESDVDLSESEEEEDLEGYDKVVSGKRKSAQWNKRNEKGETALHRACIEGNLRLVKILIEKGHPPNPRDYCGWLPLHEACNHNHQDIVEYLLDHGALISDPGGPKCDGITPLHDAIVAGNFGIAKLLLQRGASVTVKNKAGGTPLDSLREWCKEYGRHLDRETRDTCRDMDRLLTDAARRASTAAQPAAVWGGLGDSLFDTEEEQEELPAAQRRQERAPKARKAGADGRSAGLPLHAAPEFSKPAPNHPRTHHRSRSRSGDNLRRSLRGTNLRNGGDGDELSATDSEDGDDKVAVPPAFREEARSVDAPKCGASAYREAIRDLGSTRNRLLMGHPAASSTQYGDTVPTAASPSPALIAAERYVSDSEWLIDDLGQQQRPPHKRARTEPPLCRGGGGGGRSPPRSAAGGLAGGGGGGRPGSSAARPRQSRRPPRQQRLTHLVERRVVGRTHNQIRDDSDSERCSSPGSETDLAFNRELTCEERQAAGTSLAPHPHPAPALMVQSQAIPPSYVGCTMPPMRIRVRVQDKVFLIPLPYSEQSVRTVAWLAEQASTRYYSESGLRPRLQLKQEGAQLSTEDLITNTLFNNEEVLADVLSWDLPPLSERYRKACDSLGQAVDQRVQRALEAQDTEARGGAFRLPPLALGFEKLLPVLRALKLQPSVRELALPSNRVGDDLLGELAAAASTLPALARLDLSSNAVTHEGLRRLAEALGSQEVVGGVLAFQSLEELDLSLNPLGDGSCQPLAELLSCCPSLTSLRLQACGFTAHLVQHHRGLLENALHGVNRLRSVVLSHNALGSSGVDLFVRSAPSQRLARLEVSAVTVGPGDRLALDPICKILHQESCALTHLDISSNNLNDASLRELSRTLVQNKSLTWLDLSGNPDVTCCGLDILLGALRERAKGLEFLNLTGCHVAGPLGGRLRELDEAAGLLGELRLCSAALGKDDRAELARAWECGTHAGERRVFDRHGRLFLTSTESQR
ncbi:tonsoku-like protein isoform X1 [Petromyzon marinus]|uniref:tonsoku-like protein isoform X1 n=1 Tax=Petromyzon marinus TaxID=7757 RepID=UPI003F702455